MSTDGNVVFNATPNPFLLNKICLNQVGSSFTTCLLQNCIFSCKNLPNTILAGIVQGLYIWRCHFVANVLFSRTVVPHTSSLWITLRTYISITTAVTSHIQLQNYILHIYPCNVEFCTVSMKSSQNISCNLYDTGSLPWRFILQQCTFRRESCSRTFPL